MELGFKMLDWLIMLLATMAGFIMRTHNRRIDKLEECVDMLDRRLPSDFERAELTRQRLRHEEHFDKIFTILDEMRSDEQRRHVQILEKLAAKADK